ncbi:hypothetical protein GCM10028793_47530 [Nocardiopsis oceani]
MNVLGSRSPMQRMAVAGTALAALSAAANMVSPLYPTYQQLLGMSDLTMTALYATFAATALPALLLFGPAADAVGRRPALAASLACAFAGTLLFALGGTTGTLFLGRVLLGIGLGTGTGAGIAMMVEASPARRPMSGSTLATLAFVGGSGAGPLMAGIVGQYAKDPTTTPFLVMLGLLATVYLLVLTLGRGTPVVRQRWRPTRPSVPAAMKHSFAIAALTGFVGWAVVGIFLALLPSLVDGFGAVSNLAVSGAVVGALLTCSALSQLGAPRLEPRAAQTIGLTALAIGMAVLVGSHLPLFSGAPALVMTAVAAVLSGCGHGLSYWGAATEVDALTPEGCRAGVTASLYLSFYAGAGAPAVVVGLLSLGTPLISAILLVSMGLSLCIIVLLPVPSLVQTPVLSRPVPPLPRRADAVGTGDPGTGSALSGAPAAAGPVR